MQFTNLTTTFARNGHGMHDTALAYEPRPPELPDQLKRLGVTWYKVLAADEKQAAFVEALSKKGIEAVVRLYAPRPHPNWDPPDEWVKAYRKAGALFFETGNEPNLVAEWSAWPDSPMQSVAMIAAQWKRHATIVKRHGGVPVFYALSPGGHVDHRAFYRLLWDKIRADDDLKEAFQGAVIGMHPRPHNVPPDRYLHWRPATDFDGPFTNGMSTVSLHEYQWILYGFARALGYVPACIFTESGYSKGRWDTRFPEVENARWGAWNMELVRMLNPLHPRAISEPVLASCYWLIKSAGSNWEPDGPFARGDWPGDDARPDDRSWGKALWALAGEVAWRRFATGHYLVLDRETAHFGQRAQPVRYVVVHSTAAPEGSTPRGVAHYFTYNRQSVSVHELIVPDESDVPLVWRYLNDRRHYAHHAGHSRLPDGTEGPEVNEVTWAIEIYQAGEEPCDPVLVDVAAKRCALACIRWGLDESRVLLHREIDPQRRRDPVGVDGDRFRELVGGYIRAFRTLVTGGSPPAEVVPPSPPDETPPPPPGDGNGEISFPEWVQVERYEPRPGEWYWKLVRARWEEAGTHHIYGKFHGGEEQGQVLAARNQAENEFRALPKPEDDGWANIPMWAGNVYTAWAEHGPSDRVHGLTMPGNRHVSYWLEWAWVQAPEEEEPDIPSGEELAKAAWNVAVTAMNPTGLIIPLYTDAAAYKVAKAHGLGDRLSAEIWYEHAGKKWVAQVFQHGYVIFEHGRWDRPLIVPRDNENPPEWEQT